MSLLLSSSSKLSGILIVGSFSNLVSDVMSPGYFRFLEMYLLRAWTVLANSFFALHLFARRLHFRDLGLGRRGHRLFLGTGVPVCFMFCRWGWRVDIVSEIQGNQS